MTDSPATLLFVPTELELRRLQDLGGLPEELARTEICGFGAVAAAARTMQLLTRHRPRRALLLGIAGAYDVERHPVGGALAFSRVAVDGIGAGEGRSFQGPSSLGFPQWPGSPDAQRIEDALPLSLLGDADDGALLTTCAASDSPEQARERRERHPDCVAEDMEGFSVAVACSLHGVPLAIVRGVSNLVGDRDARNWRIPAALSAARKRTLELLETATWEPAR